jgi:hypothetical protein
MELFFRKTVFGEGISATLQQTKALAGSSHM